MKVILDKIFVLDLDYQSPLLQNGALTHVDYTQLKLSERVINQTRFEDVYILEPRRYYYFTCRKKTNKNLLKDIYLSDKLFLAGLIVQIDADKERIYVYNASDNLVYIKDKFEIGVIE